jgi:hypothetical protein
VEPAVSSFDFESFLIPSQGTTVLLRFPLPSPPMWADEFDAAFLHEACSQCVTIGSLVVEEMLGGSIIELNLIKRWLNQVHFAF